jgi:hypothetical protein
LAGKLPWHLCQEKGYDIAASGCCFRALGKIAVRHEMRLNGITRYELSDIAVLSSQATR